MMSEKEKKMNEYLVELLGEKEAERLKVALMRGKTIIVKGEQKSGKTTLTKVLNNAGYHAVEDFTVYEVILKEPIKNMIPDISGTIS